MKYLEGNFPQALPYAQKALASARQADEYYQLCLCALFLGQLNARLNRYRDARRAWKEALEVAIEHENLRFQGQIYINTSMLEHKRGKYESSLKLLKKGEDCADMVGDFNALATCYGRMSTTYLELNEIDLAKLYLKKMEKLASRMDIPRLKATAFFHKGSFYMKLERYKKAVSPFEKSAALFEEINDKRYQVIMLTNIASAYMGTGNQKKAETTLKKAAMIAKSTGSETIMCRISISYAELYASLKNPKQTYANYEKALTLAEKLGNEDRFILIHKSIKETLEKKNDQLPGLKDLLTRARRSYKAMGLLAQDREAKKWLERITNST